MKVNKMDHTVSGFFSSLISAGIAYLATTGKTIYVLVTTFYVSTSVPIPDVHYDFKPVVYDESFVFCFTIAGAVIGYISTFILKGILSDKDAALTIRIHALTEWLKFKKK